MAEPVGMFKVFIIVWGIIVTPDNIKITEDQEAWLAPKTSKETIVETMTRCQGVQTALLEKAKLNPNLLYLSVTCEKREIDPD
jgi:hypothetical protein